MFKKMLIATALLVALSAPAFAGESNATVTAQSNYVYRGQTVSDDFSVGLGLRFNDVVFPGVFLNGDFNSIEATPANATVRFRSDLGLGYAFNVANVPVTVSVNRVLNPVLYSADYTEARATAAFGNHVFAEVGQGLTANVNQDTYAALGVQTKLTDRVTVGVKASVVRYEVENDTRFNNAEAFAKVNVWRNLNAFASYSRGGFKQGDERIDNVFNGGLEYRF